jgi:hypothetical protein
MPERTRVPLLLELTEIPIEHRADRASRQLGGELEAQTIFQSFTTEARAALIATVGLLLPG